MEVNITGIKTERHLGRVDASRREKSVGLEGDGGNIRGFLEERWLEKLST